MRVKWNEEAESLPAVQGSFRSRRSVQLAENLRRRAVLHEAAPDGDPQMLGVIAATDQFWGDDQQWQHALVNAVPRQPRHALQAEPELDEAELERPLEEIDDPPVPDPLPLPRRGRRKSFLRRRMGKGEQPAPEIEDAFPVPAPGRKLQRVGQKQVWGVRLAVFAAPLVLIGGVAYSCGVNKGSDRVAAAPAAISPSEARVYRLTTFPTDEAAAYGSQYLRMCFVRPNPASETAVADWAAALARMTTSGVKPRCGIESRQSGAPPVSITFTGQIQEVAGGNYATGTAAQLTYIVVLADGRSFTIAVPIWALIEETAVSTRIVGDLAFLPAQIPVTVPAPSLAASVDPGLVTDLADAVLLPFLRAWAASDPVQLNLLLTEDASPVARLGMEGLLSDPEINVAQVIVKSGTPANYRDGNQVTAQLSLEWTTHQGGRQKAGYAIDLRRTAGRWLVTDITGGVLDAAGGAAPSTAFLTPTNTSLPTL